MKLHNVKFELKINLKAIIIIVIKEDIFNPVIIPLSLLFKAILKEFKIIMAIMPTKSPIKNSNMETIKPFIFITSI